ncbi:MAG: coenzyme F420-0:L-glutamate ligase [Candidatus Heimdallarchaeaceae archaeon]
MFNVHIIPIKSYKIIDESDDLLEVLFTSLEKTNVKLEDGDILVIASKVVSVVEKRKKHFSEIEPSKEAKMLAKKAKIPPEFSQIILEESGSNYIGVVPGAITTLNEYGLLANAGADQSNVGEGYVVLLPTNCKVSAKKIFMQIFEKLKKYVAIIIADSRTMPLRLGTVGCALGTYGFVPVLDERGNEDLFGRPMHITTRAIADQLATAAELLMGETSEQVPFVIIRGYPVKRIEEKDETDVNKLIPAEKCMFIGPLLPYIKKMRGK